MLWCWWGSGGASVAVRDDGGGGCAIEFWGTGVIGHEGCGGHGPVGKALPGQEGSSDGINYNNKDKREVANNDNKQ
jgi:hypothetical protein